MLKIGIITALCFAGFALGNEGAKTQEGPVEHDTFVEDLKKAKKKQKAQTARERRAQAKIAQSAEQQQQAAQDAELESKSRGLCPHCDDNSANLERDDNTNPNEVSAIVSAGEASSSGSKKSKKSSDSSKGLQ